MAQRDESSGNPEGKLTKKNLQLHKRILEENIAEGTELSYVVQGQKYLGGYKQGKGILCSCCNTELSATHFEEHAGYASRRKPFQNIYTSDGFSLHQIAMFQLKGKSISIEENDDLCNICGGRGDMLLCCDTCPRVYHTGCVKLNSVPAGKWFCQFCIKNFPELKLYANCA